MITDLAPPQERELIHEGWYHKANFTVQLVDPMPNAQPANAFTPQAYTAGRFTGDGRADLNPPATNAAVPSAANIICAVNTQGQQRYRYGNYNGWCWDGTMRRVWNPTRYPAVAALQASRGTVIQQLSFFTCKIDFAGSLGPAKRSQVPLGHFGGDPVYGACLACACSSLLCLGWTGRISDEIPSSAI